jgi:glycosyltransferase involved in cell wall biosynthesis
MGARAFVLLSLEEGLPNVILEAFAAGVPVLSTPVASVPEVVHDGMNGFLFPFGDDEALARRITEVMSDHDLHHRLALGALETARAASWERIVPEVEAVLEAAASCSRRQGVL